jgi:hypothetical protein
VTRGQNVLRGEGPSARHARQTHCKRGHPFDQRNTYVTPQGWRACRTCNSAPGRRLTARETADHE